MYLCGTRLDGDSPNDIQDYSSGGDLLPGIEGFQVVGNPIPGSTLRACGFSINGTTHCNFQWVHYLEDGTRQSIEGATMYDYVVTADDVGAVLVVECTPMDDHGRQGHLLMEFANSKQKITCVSRHCYLLGGSAVVVMVRPSSHLRGKHRPKTHPSREGHDGTRRIFFLTQAT